MSNAILPTYNRSEIALERGEGAYVWDVNGKKYLDFASGIAVSGLGHSHPHLIKALTAQAGKIWHTSNLYRVPQQERLAERLTAASFADKVFFTNSGAEAVECAMKTARRYHYVTGHPERYRIITMSAAFHGRTLATIAATDQEKLQSGFGPMPQGFDVVEFGNLAAVEAKITPETAAIMVEPVQGEGGIRPVPKDQLQALRTLADKHGLLLILDEIQCGMGRTGKLFAHEHAGVVPDIVATAKGIGGGFPLGACLMTDKAAQGMVAGTHGSTYGGNPLACAVGNAVLDIILAPGFLDQVTAAAGQLEDMLGKLAAEHPGTIEAVRGLGLIRGLKLRPGVEVRDLVLAGRAHGILTVPAGNNVIRLLPPLTIGAAEIDEAYDKLNLAVKDLEPAAAAKPGAA